MVVSRQHAVRLTGFPEPSDVRLCHTWRSDLVPDLGLAEDISNKYRIYIIECKAGQSGGPPVYYVGICEASELRSRLEKHWAGSGAHFTKVNKPQRVHLIWPAAPKSAEGYAYYAMLETLPPNSARRLGGWVQTSSNPSALGCDVIEQARRNMKDKCFNCGVDRYCKSHTTRVNGRIEYKCPHPLRGVEYACPNKACGCKIMVTTRGHAEPVATPPGGAASSSSASSSQTAAASGTSATGTKRKAGSLATVLAQPRAKVAKASISAGLHVDVCGKGYTSLSWFLGVQNPSKPACRHVEQHCVADAVLLDGGHTRSLANTPYAKKHNQKPKPLLGDLRRLSVARFVQTEIAGLKVKRCDGTLEGRRKSQILWSQESLRKAWENF